MEHDGPQDGNSCDADNFVMSPTLGSGKTTWSSCSRDYLEKFLQTSQSSCIQSASSHVNILHQFHSGHKLPGQIFDASQQCALRFGPDSRKSQIQPLEDICRLLRCDTGPKRSIVVYHAHPALEGSTCGHNKVSPCPCFCRFPHPSSRPSRTVCPFLWDRLVVSAGILRPNDWIVP